MRRRKLLWKIYPAYLFITLATVLIVSIFVLRKIAEFQTEQKLEDITREAMVIADEVEQLAAPLNPVMMDKMCKKLGRRTDMRVTVILPDGKVIGDSEKNPEEMESHRDRPEVGEALHGQMSHATRYSDTLKRNMMYLGYPLKINGRIVGVVRTSVSLAAVEEGLRKLYDKIILATIVVILLAAIASLVLSRSLSRPLDDMRRGAERVARGDFDLRLATPDSEEMASLAVSLNEMAGQLNDRIRRLAQQHNELEAVLSSMLEGVVAVDRDQKILRINKAAADLLGTSTEDATGKILQQVIRNVRLQEFAVLALSSKQPVEADVILETDGERYIQANGTALRDVDGKTVGALIVLNDVTKSRNLENARREFVANVSHELKTPVTSIKGFVETLRDGAAKNPDDLNRFLGIIAKQADRLDSIMNDILSLSRIEHDGERNRIELQRVPLVSLLKDAVEICRDRAAKKNMKLNITCGEALTADLNPALFEQAVVNLVDNAVKYSPEGSTVEIRAEESVSQVVVSVTDHGSGIEKPHLSRIFERFYRVDKGRSRQMGGTGLGLSIVKHIALAHKGTVGVQSAPGIGSTFSVYLPRNDD